MEFKILNVETIADELSLDDLRGGLNPIEIPDSDDCNINVFCPKNETLCGTNTEKNLI